MPTKILLADDSVTIQKVVELTFSDGDYEVVLTSNGAEAIDAISGASPDLILSDIIMPEKNGYELCEFVKSHPEYKTIPVVLLTGTFEPFDPERAEKAGCDAVVTKPFESQSLIQKVEELLRSRSQGGDPPAASETIPAGVTSPFAEDEAPAEQDQGETPQPQEEPPPPQGDVFESEIPGPAEDSATRMIPKMSLEDLQRMQSGDQEPGVDAPAGDAGEIPPPPPPAETESAQSDSPLPPPPAAQSAGSAPFHQSESPPPFGAPPAEPTGPLSDTGPEVDENDATRMIPKMTLEDLQKMREQSSDAEPSAAPSGASQEEDSASPFDDGGDAAPPPFEQSASSEQPPTFEQPAPDQSAGFDQGTRVEEEEPFGSQPDEPDEDSSTRMIPKMSLEDIQRMQQEQETALGDEEPGEPASGEELGSPGGSFGDDAPAPSFASETPSPFDSPAPPPDSERPSELDASDAGAESSPQLPSESGDEWAPTTSAPGNDQDDESRSVDDDLVERIAQRVVDKLSDSVIREIAWDVIPETAERVVRERVRELEAAEE